MHPEAIEKAVEIFDSQAELVLLSVGRGLVNSAGQPIDFTAETLHPANTAIPGYQIIQTCLFPLKNLIGEPSTVMYRRRASGEGFDPMFRHIGDIEYWLRILMEGDYYFIPDEYCLFRCHDDSRSTSNARGLMVGPDLMRLTRKFSWVIESCGQTEAEFLHQSLASFAGHVLVQKESSQISQDFLRDGRDVLHGLPDSWQSDPILSRLVADLLDFRELAFHSLLILGANAAGLSRIPQREDPIIAEYYKRIRELESSARTMLQSRSWHYTRPLREIRKAFSAAGADSESDFEIDTTDDTLSQHEAYISYLQDLIKRIEESRSWKISQPFRALGMIMNPAVTP